MADYFMLLDGIAFESRVRPALAQSWRQRSFAPCRKLAADLVPAAEAYAGKYHVGAFEPLVSRVAENLLFDRAIWRGFVSEVLLFSAVEIPEIQTCLDTLVCLLTPERHGCPTNRRDELSPIEQAHLGSRDLTFGSALYRPEHAGLNSAASVARLADYLVSVQTERWTVAQLALLGDVPEEEKADELEFAREWFPVLVELFQRARERSLVIVHEAIY